MLINRKPPQLRSDQGQVSGPLGFPQLQPDESRTVRKPVNPPELPGTKEAAHKTRHANHGVQFGSAIGAPPGRRFVRQEEIVVHAMFFMLIHLTSSGASRAMISDTTRSKSQ